MQEQDGKNQFNISQRLEDLRRDREALRWEGSFRDYFELVAQNPRIAQLSHARINDMIHAAGIEKLNEGTRDEIARYNFFATELFGIEEPIARIVEYFKSAAQRWRRKRILRLMGPVAAASQRCDDAQRGLEVLRERAGRRFPHQVPDARRRSFDPARSARRDRKPRHLHRRDLCPQVAMARARMAAARSVRVQRISSLCKDRGIALFSPSDPKSQYIPS